MATVDSLMQKFGVSAAACDSKVTEVHLQEISQNHCSKWRDLPTPLGLSKMAVNDLEYKPGGEGGKRKAFLETWQQQMGGDATYRALITALLNVQSRDDAESVCKLLQGAPAHPAPQTQATNGAGCTAAGKCQRLGVVNAVS